MLKYASYFPSMSKMTCCMILERDNFKTLFYNYFDLTKAKLCVLHEKNGANVSHTV